MTDESPGPLVEALRIRDARLEPVCLLRADQQLSHLDSVLFGRRGLYRPNVALQTIQRLGPARHAIAQRTVAGTVEIHAPFAPKPATPKVDPKGGSAARAAGAPRPGPSPLKR